MKRVTLGGGRLGSGNRMKVELKGYERSTHDKGYLWRSTMAAGTLVPFMNDIALPGDTWDITLDCDAKTHPTVGPLFGSYKIQLDVFACPIRLYQGQLHNNKLNIGRDMSQVKLPQMELSYLQTQTIDDDNPDNAQINPSCILSYLGIRGIGSPNGGTGLETRDFNATGLLSYWDIIKNYYINKQEENAYVIHREIEALVQTVDDIEVGAFTLPQGTTGSGIYITFPDTIVINYTGTQPLPSQIVIYTNVGIRFLSDIVLNFVAGAGTLTGNINWLQTGNITLLAWSYVNQNDLVGSSPILVDFPITNLDEMRENILLNQTGVFKINSVNLEPYSLLLDWPDEDLPSPYLNTQEGLAVKTYQSDLFNNWLNTEWIDQTGNPNAINQITAVAIDPATQSFKIDALNLAKKVYDMLNRVAVSGGTYQDWLEVTYDHEVYMRMETPVYEGGLIKEMVFQEVISNNTGSANNLEQPLGTLAGRGVLAKKHKGGRVRIKVDEPSVIMGIASITPRIDYSQGNDWHTHLKTMNDFHKPALDEIGFQDLIQEQMGWWTTELFNTAGIITEVAKSAGKQPAWINYMTSVNKVLGNFAIADNEMFMVLNRRYEKNGTDIKDMTTYIDPVKCNYSFADTAIDAQNFWMQISVDAEVRRKMSAKLMPNL